MNKAGLQNTSLALTKLIAKVGVCRPKVIAISGKTLLVKYSTASKNALRILCTYNTTLQ